MKLRSYVVELQKPGTNLTVRVIVDANSRMNARRKALRDWGGPGEIVIAVRFATEEDG